MYEYTTMVLTKDPQLLIFTAMPVGAGRIPYTSCTRGSAYTYTQLHHHNPQWFPLEQILQDLSGSILTVCLICSYGAASLYSDLMAGSFFLEKLLLPYSYCYELLKREFNIFQAAEFFFFKLSKTVLFACEFV
jgi:hypothetical protein